MDRLAMGMANLGMCLAVAVGLAASTASAKKGGGGYTPAQAVEVARDLAVKAGMTVDKQDILFERLEKHFAAMAARRPGQAISAVVAYQMGEGGLIVKVKKGRGLVRYFGTKEDVPLELKSVSVGANIGGSSEWGVGIVFGLGEPGFFGGDYSGSTRGATAGEASTNTTELRKARVVDPHQAHEVVLLGTAAGLSANAGSAKLTIRVLR